MMKSLYHLLKQWFVDLGTSSSWGEYLGLMISLICIAIIAMILYYISRKIIWSTLPRLVSRTKSRWDDFMFKNKFFRGFAHLFPAAFFYSVSGFADSDFHLVTTILTEGTKIYITLIFVYLVDRFLDTVLDIYNTYPFAKERPIKGYIQMVKIFLYVMGGIILISILLVKNPSTIVGGLGAMAAVLMLVFKDTILGLVASVQLAANKMLQIGDWIEMPSRMADGTVEDISLNTVKVQNWDKTITTIPTYAMISESVKNWRGMEESGGRRIKKSILIDIKSLQVVDEATFNKMQQDGLVNLEMAYHMGITNVTLYREYTKTYLAKHPQINNDMTQIVRQLQQTPAGLPLEIYAFSMIKDWQPYEELQSSIVETLLATMAAFNLKVYQYPSHLIERTK
ncbi:mechanosensitive ion channel family protein [Halosquirtibacter xylanolyticus]|uniref:mechanosensitive ion channel family protein n=1 Tax=Halosquirtibacter xylanolyticus TaxID=3374599 RepID=UPI003748BC5E|nr:mechanosensitive ion channel family protein [Prolixibacteraceae bacterium]